MKTTTRDDQFEQWVAAMPESKLELIEGKLIISTLAGSRWVLWALLKDYGPDLVLSMAPPELWWTALQIAYTPQPPPQTPDEWRAWADGFLYEPAVAPAGPCVSETHRRMYDILMWGLHYVGEMSQVGRQLGRDFVIRLGENGLTPDVIFIARDRLPGLYDRYLDGPPTIAIEITMAGSEDQDRLLKRLLYEHAGVPEYWLVEPELLHITFYRLQSDGRYTPLTFGASEVQRIVETKADTTYESVALPGLSLSLLQLWTMEGHDWKDRWRPFRPLETAPDARISREPPEGGITWDSIPFVPRVELSPVPIRFGEFVSWCGRAKFERYGGGLKIDGTEGTRRVAGMLVMTFGVIEVVKLVHPREWVTLLHRAPDQATGEGM